MNVVVFLNLNLTDVAFNPRVVPKVRKRAYERLRSGCTEHPFPHTQYCLAFNSWKTHDFPAKDEFPSQPGFLQRFLICPHVGSGFSGGDFQNLYQGFGRATL